MFEEIIGYESIKTDLSHLVAMLNDENKFKSNGIIPYRSLMLTGEPGTGKTFMCEQLIKEVEGKGNLPRKIYKISPSAVESRIDESIKNTFEDAIREYEDAKNSALIFIDDLDKFFGECSYGESSQIGGLIQSYMEKTKNMTIFVLATANYPEFIDRSLMRSGRFGYRICVGTPNKDDSKLILQKFIGKDIEFDSINAEEISDVLCGYTTATLNEIIKEAKALSLIESGKVVLSKKNLIRSIQKIVLSMIDVEEASDRCREITAYHEAGHVVIALIHGIMTNYVSIEGGTRLGGLTTMDPNIELITCEDIETYCKINLAGNVTTYTICEVKDQGAKRDFTQCENLLYAAVSELYNEGVVYRGGRSSCTKNQELMEFRVTDKIRDLYKQTMAEVKENRDLIHDIAEALLKEGTLLKSDILNISKNHGIDIAIIKNRDIRDLCINGHARAARTSDSIDYRETNN